jgi:flagella basal body P-ring formation protein FlgA
LWLAFTRAGTLFALELTTVGSSTVESSDVERLARLVPVTTLLMMQTLMTKTAALPLTRQLLARMLALCLLGSPAAQAASPQEALTAELAKWVALQNQVPIDQVIVAPLDTRVSVQPCASQYSFDYPFVNRESVRARCLKPAWQLYVKVGFAQVHQTPAANAKTSNQAGQVATQSPSPTPSTPASPESRMVLVAASNLTVGQLLQPEMFKLEKVDADKINRSFLFEATGLEGQELVRPLRAGEPIRNVDMRQAIMVKRGELVQLTVGKAGEFQISVRLEAMQDGRLGEQIKLRNNESGRILGGVVTGKGFVKGS